VLNLSWIELLEYYTANTNLATDGAIFLIYDAELRKYAKSIDELAFLM
jgi:hypothetical protein